MKLLELYEEKRENSVSATEELMLDHAIIRRMLAIFASTAKKLRSNDLNVNFNALNLIASLFLKFAHHHEKIEEEKHVFPIVRQINEELANTVGILIEQHDQSHEATENIIFLTKKKIDKNSAETLIELFDALGTLYANHGTREETEVFIAWRKALSEDKLKSIEETFETLEKKAFGGDAFEMALQIIQKVEWEMGLADLTKFNI